MRVMISLSWSRISASKASIWVKRSGMARSDSAKASPQVGKAGQAIEARRVRLKGSAGDSMLLQSQVDSRLVLRQKIDQQEVLRGGQPHLGLILFNDLPKRTFEPIALGVMDVAVFHKQPQKTFPVVLPMPTEEIALASKLKAPGGLELDTGPHFHFMTEPFHAAIVNDILSRACLRFARSPKSR